jgi:hypothetical protein
MADYSAYKIPQFQKPYKPTFDAFVDKLETDRNDYETNGATQAWVQSQIASGGVDWSTFGDPLDILQLNGAGDTPQGLTYQELAALLNPYITGGGGGSYNESTKRIYIGNPTTSNNTIYTATEKTSISSIRINNSTGDASTNIKLSVTPSGDTAKEILNLDLDGTTQGIIYHEFPQIILNVGDTIQTQAGTNDIYTLSLTENIIDLDAHERLFMVKASTVKSTIFTVTSTVLLTNIRINNSVSSPDDISFYLSVTPTSESEKILIDTTYDHGTVVNEELNLKLFTGDILQIQSGQNDVFMVTATGKAV